MKKLITLLLMLIMVISLASCSVLPDSVNNVLDGVKSSVVGVIDSIFGEHVHDFVAVETKAATCTEDGYEVQRCSCGEQQTVVLPGGHDIKTLLYNAATCTVDGKAKYKCNVCGFTETVVLTATGHNYDDDTEASRLRVCRNDQCSSAVLTESNGKYAEVLTFDFSKDDEDAITALYEEVLAAVTSAPAYDPELHAYVEEGELYDAFKAVEAKHEELYDLVLNAIAQRQVAQVLYYCDMSNTTLEDNYSYMMDYYTDLIATFYSLSQPYYDSCYRDFYYYGMTEEEIWEYLFDSNAVSDEEYVALNDRNSEIELAFLNLDDPGKSADVPTLYAEFVENNKKIAEILGYDNYLEYAYENVYDRDYSYTDVEAIADYVKENISSVYADLYDEYFRLMNNGADYSATDVENFYSQVGYSFFSDIKSNTTVNDYVDLMAFTTNPDKQISFSDTLNDLMSGGNLFRGDYEGAYVTYLAAAGIPIAYFSEGYDTPFSIVHEFGHYMNEIYNAGNEDLIQSYDLLEMHSQGNEMLYLYFVKDQLTENAFMLTEAYELLVTFDTVIAALAVDTFEQAVYLNSYDGAYSETIMADGVITANEYDLLYESILEDFGVADYQPASYWRYVTITSPCYYVSYSVSALSVLQLYEMANEESFDAAKESYLKLFTYTDTEGSLEMTTEEVLLYAGMKSFNDEELYKSLAAFLKETINNLR